jgi:vanadium chloroperoxidase
LTKDSSDPAYRLPDLLSADNARLAVAGAAITVLEALYARPDPAVSSAATNELGQFIQRLTINFPDMDLSSSSYRFGMAVGNAILDLLALRPDEPGVGQGSYRPSPGPYRYQDDPVNPIRLVPVDPNNPNGPKRAVRVYVAPFYGMTAKRVAVQMRVNGKPNEHIIADPPVGYGTNDPETYQESLADVIRMGGETSLNSTRRTPDQTAGGYYWAYDGANLLGTPPRLYNQILRQVAWAKKPAGPTDDKTNADFARLFALANAAVADAGIFSWQQKYCFEFARPVTGVRYEEGIYGDPFWLPEGAPDTNSNRVPFTPPFPAYPSGHATFGAAIFQIARLYYRKRDNLSWKPDEPDNIGFSFISEELNGISRDLRQPYDPSQPITEQVGTVRTRVRRSFESLWAAMFENAVSRVWIGVHWTFDAFALRDVFADAPGHVRPDGTTAYKWPADIRYRTTGPRADRPGKTFPIGGVPLGINIANDIFQGNLRPTPPRLQPTGRNRCGNTVDDERSEEERKEGQKHGLLQTQA